MKKLICDKIYNFNTLAVDEKRQMIEHISACPECKMIFKKLLLEENQSADKHIEWGLLNHYVIYKNHPNEIFSAQDALSAIEVDLVKRHLKECTECHSKFLQNQQVFAELEKFWEEAELPNFELNPVSKVNHLENIFRKLIQHLKGFEIHHIQLIRRLAISTVLIGFFFILNQFFNNGEPSLQELAHLNEIYIPYSVRSSPNNLQLGIMAFNQKDFNLAISKFGNYVNNSTNTQKNNYAQYLLGLSYVMQSSIDSEKKTSSKNFSLLLLGIENLTTALTATENSPLRENILWYLAKAHLMKKDIVKAIEFFEKVKLLKGLKAEASQDMLIKLQNFSN